MLPLMQSRFNSPTTRAAGWMAGWLTLMVVIAVAGREAARELSVFHPTAWLSATNAALCQM